MDLLLESNPFRRHRRYRRRYHRNPLANPTDILKPVKSYMMGIGAPEIAAAAGGLVLASWLPGVVIKPPVGGVLSTGQKVLKVLVAVVASLGAGMGAKQVFSAKAGEAAVAGGLAGAAVQAIGAFTTWTLPTVAGPTAIPARIISRFGDARTVSPSMTREGENVQLIQP